MTIPHSLTLIIPAYNEEKNIEGTVEDILPFLLQLESYEILIFDDHSTDQTGKLCDQMAAKNSHLRVIHNTQNMGLGFNYKEGVRQARKDYVLMIPGDRDMRPQTYETLFQKMGSTDMVICYTGNIEIRPMARQLVSKTFTGMMNFLFGTKLKYFNGIVLHKRNIIQSISIETNGFAYQAEALIKLLKKGHSYEQTPQWIFERQHGSSKAFYPKNIYRVLKALIQLFFKIQIQKNY